MYLDSVNKVEINDIVQVEPEKNILSFWKIHLWQILFFICLGLLLLSLLKNHMNNLRQKPNSRNGKFEDFEKNIKNLKKKYKELEFKNNELLSQLRISDESSTILKSKLDKLEPPSTDAPKVNEVFFEIKNSEQNTLYPNTEIFYMTGPVTNYFPLNRKEANQKKILYINLQFKMIKL